MAKLNRKQIQQVIYDILADHSGGTRWSELLARIHSAHPDTPYNSISGATHALFQSSADITKVAKGTYQLAKYGEAQASAAIAQDEIAASEPVTVTTPEQKTVTIVESDSTMPSPIGSSTVPKRSMSPSRSAAAS